MEKNGKLQLELAFKKVHIIECVYLKLKKRKKKKTKKKKIEFPIYDVSYKLFPFNRV